MSESTDRELRLISQLNSSRDAVEFQLSNNQMSSTQREFLTSRLTDIDLQLKHARRRLAREEERQTQGPS
jgi:hypothetical protein